MRFVFLIVVFLCSSSVQAQVFYNEQNKLVWEKSMNDPRLKAQIVSSFEMALSGQEAISLKVTNNGDDELFYDVTVIIRAFSGEVKKFNRSKIIKPGESIGGNTWFDGEQYGFKGEKKDYGQGTNGASCKTFISNVELQVNQIRNITKEKAVEAKLKEESKRKREAELQKKLEVEEQKSKSASTNQENQTIRQQKKQINTDSTTRIKSNYQTSKSDADSRFEEEMRKANKILLEAEEKRERDAAQAKQQADQITNFAAGVIRSFQEDAEKRNEERLQASIKRQQKEERDNAEGSLLLKIYLPDAEQGNEKAIEKAARGYELMQKTSIKIDFLKRMVDIHKSRWAYNALNIHYTNIIDEIKAKSKLNRKKGIKKAVWGSVLLVGIGIVGGNYVLNDTKVFKDESLRDIVYYTSGVGGILGGSTLCISSIISFGRTGYKRDATYLNAAENLKSLQTKYSLSISPSFDFNAKNFGFALKLSF